MRKSWLGVGKQVQPAEYAVCFYQFLIIAVLEYLAFSDDKYPVCTPNGAEPVCNYKDGAVFKQIVEGVLNGIL